jgi:hypothetical protein
MFVPVMLMHARTMFAVAHVLARFSDQPFLQALGLGPADFKWMSAMSSWAVCDIVGKQPSRAQRAAATVAAAVVSGNGAIPLSDAPAAVVDAKAEMGSGDRNQGPDHDHGDNQRDDGNGDGDDDADLEHDAADSGEQVAHIKDVVSPEERTLLGLKCKQLLDQGRCAYLQRLGYDATLIRYIDRTVTRENMLLLAVPRRNQ